MSFKLVQNLEDKILDYSGGFFSSQTVGKLLA